MPRPRDSNEEIYLGQRGFVLARIRSEQWLAEFLHAKLADSFLCFGGDHEILEGHRAIRIDLFTIIGIHCDDVVDIEQRFFAFGQDVQVQRILVRQVSGAVGEGVALFSEAMVSVAPMPCPVSRYQAGLVVAGSSSAAFQIPSSLVLVPDLSARATKGASAAAMALKRIRSPHALDAGRVGGRADDDEVVMHDQFAFLAGAFIHECLLGCRRVDQEHVGVALLAHFHGLAGADSHSLYNVTGLLLEERDEHIQQAGILGGSGGGQDDVRIGGSSRSAGGEQENRCEYDGNDAFHFLLLIMVLMMQV